MKAKDLLLRMMDENIDENYYLSIKEHYLEDSQQFILLLPFTLSRNQIVILTMCPVVYGKVDYSTRKEFKTKVNTELDIRIIKNEDDNINLKVGFKT